MCNGCFTLQSSHESERIKVLSNCESVCVCVCAGTLKYVYLNPEVTDLNITSYGYLATCVLEHKKWTPNASETGSY